MKNSLHSYQENVFQNNNNLANTESVALVEESPIAISVNGIAYAVMMATPVNLHAFVIGFAFSEGLIEHLHDIRDVNIGITNAPLDIKSITIDLEVSPRCFNHFKQRKKVHLGATGCGLCGVESLTHAIPELPKLATSKSIKESDLLTLRGLLQEQQVIGNKTGAIHAALLLSADNVPLCCMEDIGRHNALDKVIGYALQHNINLHDHNVLMSSRCSSELVQKAVRVGLSALTHLASPSTLAVKLAKHYGLTLIHLPQKDAPRVFASSLQSEDTNNE